MKTFFAAALLATVAFASPASVFVAGSALAATCGADAPAGWKRPGGYCSQIESNSSLAAPGGGDSISSGDCGGGTGGGGEVTMAPARFELTNEGAQLLFVADCGSDAGDPTMATAI